jgi:hypothetical protein
VTVGDPRLKQPTARAQDAGEVRELLAALPPVGQQTFLCLAQALSALPRLGATVAQGLTTRLILHPQDIPGIDVTFHDRFSSQSQRGGRWPGPDYQCFAIWPSSRITEPLEDGMRLPQL